MRGGGSRIQLTPLLDLLIIVIFALLASTESKKSAELAHQAAALADGKEAAAELEVCKRAIADADEVQASLVTKENEAASLREQVRVLRQEVDTRTAQLREVEAQLEEDRRRAAAEAQALATMLSEKLGTEVGKAAIEQASQTMSATARREFRQLLETLDSAEPQAVVTAIRDSAIVAARVNLLRIHLDDDGRLRFRLESKENVARPWRTKSELSPDYPVARHVRDFLDSETNFPDRPLWIVLQTYGPGASNLLRRDFLNSETAIRNVVFAKMGGGKSLVVAGGGLSLSEEAEE